MKAPLILALLSGGGIALAAYTLDWSTLDSGGGQSSAGAYSVAGTIAQPDAGKLSGGNYTVTGGFWSMPELLQVPGGPPLEYRTIAGSVWLAWPAPSPGWRLETSTNLSSWSVVPGAPALSGDFLLMMPDTSSARRYYRLALP
jgi:hypothetical protein